ncbi:16333_t:CDS:2 [Cetraspora pellucida]|uniref:16333_t:CDS:1 n=1 Tax=Cetraspora pellucida TaxID=1433469 RepID=A0ACA9LBP1_9GLOM|nr:16333_t:CDS:2 [Cetraspora pellucida]
MKHKQKKLKTIPLQEKNLVNNAQNKELTSNKQVDMQDIQNSQDYSNQENHLINDNISDIQLVDNTSQRTSNTKNNKLDEPIDNDLSDSEDSESSESDGLSKTLSSSNYLRNNTFNLKTSGSFNNKSSITRSTHIEYSTDSTLNKILDIVLNNQNDIKVLLRLHGEMESTIRSQSDEIKKLKDLLSNSHKTEEESSRAQWVEPYWKYIVNDIFPDFKYPSDETIKTHRETIVKKIKDKLFEVFQDKLNKIDSSASADTIKTFKDSANTKWCLCKLNNPISTISSQTYMDSIISKVWTKHQPTEDDKVFAIAICLYILDPKYEGMKLDPEKVGIRGKSPNQSGPRLIKIYWIIPTGGTVDYSPLAGNKSVI